MTQGRPKRFYPPRDWQAARREARRLGCKLWRISGYDYWYAGRCGDWYYVGDELPAKVRVKTSRATWLEVDIS